MMIRLRRFACLIFGFSLISPLLQAAPQLNGIATHQELGKERFIAALYSESAHDDPMALLRSTEPRRMELKVTTQRLSARRLNNMWIEGMAINNSATSLEAHAENMVKFAGFVKKRLVAGDVLAIDGVPGQGALVSVNGVELGSVESDTFFNMLLATWIGPVPLSSDFRSGLLLAGRIPGDLLGRYTAITPEPSRIDEIAAWSAPPPETALPAAEAPAAVEAPAEQAPAATVAAAPVIAAAPTPTPAAPQIEAPPPRPQQAAPAPAPRPEPTPAPVRARPAATAVAPPPDEEIIDDLIDEDELEDSEEALTAESLLSRQLYHSKLKRWTYGYLKYPARAQKRGQQGSVRLSVSIDRQGNVKTVAAVQESRYSLLNREALGAVERATPFPPVPDEVKGEEFTFSLPIVFRLPD